MKIDKRLLRQTGSVRLYLGITVGVGLLSALLIICQAHFLSQIIDRVFLQSSYSALALPLIALLGVIAARAGLAWWSEVSANSAAGRVKSRLRESLFAHLLKLGPTYTRKERSGELTNVAVEGVESLDAYFSQYLPQVFLTMLVPVLVLAVITIADPLSGLVLALSAPVLPIFMILIGKKAEAISKKQWNQMSQMSAHFLDVMQGLTTLKLLGRSRLQEEKIGEITDRYRKTTMKVLSVAFLSALVMEIGATICTAIVAVEVGLRLVYGQTPFQPALFVLLLAPEFYLPMRSLGQRFHASMSAGAAAGRIFEVLETPAETTSSADKTSENAMLQVKTQEYNLLFENVHFAYENGKRPALRGVSFEIKWGEKVVLVGHSGAGKSTVAQLLLRFIEPEQGQIFLQSRTGESLPLADIPAKTWREQVAWVPQNPYLFNTTVANNIRLGKPGATLDEVMEAARRAHAHEFIQALPQGYDTVIGERGARLSGGQAQRLSLARAFLRNAPLLILDEATSNLDPENEALVLDATEKLMEGRTVLFIAHRPSTIARADRTIRLEAGQVAEVVERQAQVSERVVK